MDMESGVRRGHPIIFGTLLVIAIIEACITSYITGKSNAANNWPDHSYRDRTKFLVFTSWWSVVIFAVHLAFFIVAAGSFISSILTHWITIGLTWLFWLAGVASLTAALGGGKRCSDSDLVYCNQYVAAEAFGWIEWILLTITFFFLLGYGGMAMRRGDGLSGGLV